jgi:hypothetical protein
MYSPSGDLIASASDDMTVRLWDVETGECRNIFIGHSKCVNVALFSPDGDLVASASDDGTVRLWDVASGRHRAVIREFGDSVIDITWIETSDACNLVTGDLKGSVRMWEVTDEEVRLRWGSMNNLLAVTDTIIQDVQGLDQLNEQLLKQRGAVGEPAQRLRDASRKVVSMASVVSKLKADSKTAVEKPPPAAGATVGELAQRAEQLKDPLFRDIVAAFVKDLGGSNP